MPKLTVIRIQLFFNRTNTSSTDRDVAVCCYDEMSTLGRTAKQDDSCLAADVLTRTPAVFAAFARQVGLPGYFDSKLTTTERAQSLRSITQQSIFFSLNRPAAARSVIASCCCLCCLCCNAPNPDVPKNHGVNRFCQEWSRFEGQGPDSPTELVGIC
jgi:hypothetical protein